LDNWRIYYTEQATDEAIKNKIRYCLEGLIRITELYRP